MTSLDIAKKYVYKSVQNRYVVTSNLVSFFKTLSSNFKITTLGRSVKDEAIYGVTVGSGKIKIAIWSQMHGNESTTTKGLLDFLHFLNTNSSEASFFLNTFTLHCIPILNPDGAFLYTRENANLVDLNRDANLATQPESKILRQFITNIQPDFAFNLHDQRTIFGTENTKLPATMSFLAPSYNKERSFNTVRLQAVGVITAIFKELSVYIPNQIGRFDDSFNINCIGDYLTAQNIPTILFEAGHFKNDYNREEVRNFVFIALFSALQSIYKKECRTNLDLYFSIPQNSKCFFDFLYKKVTIMVNNEPKIITFASQYKEVLKDGIIEFQPYIIKVGNLENYIGHTEIDGNHIVLNNMINVGDRDTIYKIKN